MGYLVAAHVVQAEPPFGMLDRLPASLGWAVYREPDTGAYLIDVFDADRALAQPFARLPRSLDLVQDLPGELTPLNALHAVLLRQRRASPFRRKYISLNLLLARALEMPVLSLACDDEGLDLACASFAGQLRRLRFRTGALEIIWNEGHSAVQPLRFDDDSALTDADLLALKGCLPGGELLSPVYVPSLLHRIAGEECKAFLGSEATVLGLGTWERDHRVRPVMMRGRRQR